MTKNMAFFNLFDMVLCIQVFNGSQDLIKQKVFTNQRTKREWKNNIPHMDPAHRTLHEIPQAKIYVHYKKLWSTIHQLDFITSTMTCLSTHNVYFIIFNNTQNTHTQSTPCTFNLMRYQTALKVLFLTSSLPKVWKKSWNIQ